MLSVMSPVDDEKSSVLQFTASHCGPDSTPVKVSLQSCRRRAQVRRGRGLTQLHLRFSVGFSVFSCEPQHSEPVNED